MRLKGFADIAAFPLRPALDAGLLITINSDDPAYFGGYLDDNLRAITATYDRSLWDGSETDNPTRDQ